MKIETENRQTHERTSAPGLRELVERTGSAGDRFLVIQRIPHIPGAFASVWHEEGGEHRPDHRPGEDGFFGFFGTDPRM
ncbi:hypothetical protein [Streptomyces sp. NPDC058964]|uniref:hypothetical protein n=1 Tax=Streptomyces sp. NPDC058964 TaxID=3346681 RepID=UPI0036B5099F